ncbi:hypothetical protein KAZ01_00050 [Candidatus Gracilibacteria bacterium]|nr:hypothetical protein [Candidatus Gracilibacteria bacterium]
MNKEFRIYLEKLKIEIGDFLRICETCNNRYGLLKARKSSIKLRNMLKEFRKIILEKEKKINEKVKENNEKIQSEFFDNFNE